MKLSVVVVSSSMLLFPFLSIAAEQKNPASQAQNSSSTAQTQAAATQMNVTGQAPKSVAAAPSPLPPVPEYSIGTEDVLAINVWKEPELSRTVPVRPDGKVTVPLIGEIQAKGLTPNQLEANISQALKSFVANPEVSVIVQEVHSQKFNILGEVGKPGSYPLAKPTTVLDGIALAGGFKDFAKTTKIFVLRVRTDASRQNLPFNYKDVIKGKRFEQNVELMPGDTIIVP